jgi:antirestriction protein ArdC
MQTQAQIRADLTQKIIEALTQGVIPWRKPWRDVPDPVRLPTNYVTQREYHGFNILALGLAAQVHGYSAGYWASYNQWRSVGAQVRKGEKSTQIILWKPISIVEQREDGQEVEKSFPILRTWSVFNVGQVEGESAEQYRICTQPSGPAFPDVSRTEFAETVAATKADIRVGGNKAAYYRPPSDHIVVPHEDQFLNFPAYAETVLHELCHWTEWRTGWSGSYAEGELRAEIGACLLSSALGVPSSDDLRNHAAYLQSWLRALKDDPKFIFRASAAASKAADCILGFSRTTKDTTSEPAAESVC